MYRLNTWTVILIAAWLLSSLSAGCSGRQPVSLNDLQTVATAQSMTVRRLNTNPFTLLALSPRIPAGQVLRVYIEGDGRAWISRSRLSSDPTPTNPLALELMAVDNTPDKAYLARPCQYLQTGACNDSYWSGHRFSQEVVDSMNEALNQLKDAGNYRHLELVGYSGGGTMAALLAARRDDVRFLRTIAGNLDHVWLNKHHKVSPLTGSLNPPDFADRLSRIPQRHFVGENDRIVPLAVYRSYAGFFRDTGCLAVTTVPGADHVSGWQENWPRSLEEAPGCRN
ncbi:MAG: hypothetical protein A2521_10860 [Deltaproteobacteria bacterium RIFOXYD12_FULL_57_12]|nr:MAG: hypothetical protein A2521_10860 [Deltaproteobacteria bacterium RIFOXYD12_FULL_57_12]